MRTKFLSARRITLLSVLLFVAFFAFSADAVTLYRDLRLGNRGEDVRMLQVALNMSQQTQVAFSGPGSPGQETNYFGPLTFEAVKNYQEVYASVILYPLNLFVGTGFVGPATRSHFAQQQMSTISPSLISNNGVDADMLSSQEADIRNAENRDLFIDLVRSRGSLQGMSEDELDAIEESILDQSRISMDELTEQFIEGREQFDEEPRNREQILEDVETLSYNPQNTFAKQIRSFGQSVAPFFSLSPQPAYAQGYTPVGGPIYYTYLCTCSFTWLILLGPPRPGLVDYETGSQGYASFNLPYARYLLGNAVSAGAVCVTEPEAECAVTIPSTYGILTPIVGSSAI